MSVLKDLYESKIKQELIDELGLKSVMEAPKLVKISINSGIGSFRDNREAVESFVNELAMLSGQKPYERKSRLSESGFKLRKGETVGYAVTLRGERMWSFLDKFVNVVLPRVRDFKGLNPKSFDKAGNYSIGIQEHVIFPEVDPNKTRAIRGLQVTLNMKVKEREHSRILLEKLGLLFAK